MSSDEDSDWEALGRGFPDLSRLSLKFQWDSFMTDLQHGTSLSGALDRLQTLKAKWDTLLMSMPMYTEREGKSIDGETDKTEMDGVTLEGESNDNNGNSTSSEKVSNDVNNFKENKMGRPRLRTKNTEDSTFTDPTIDVYKRQE